MGPKTVVEKPVPPEHHGDVVEYTFEFEQHYCGWDALHIVEFEGITFPENRSFAWCGPLIGLTPSNRLEDIDTILELPRPAEKVLVSGHTANAHYEFRGHGEPIEALDEEGYVVDRGNLDVWFRREQKKLILRGDGIKLIRLPSSKPVFFLKRMEVHFIGRTDGDPGGIAVHA